MKKPAWILLVLAIPLALAAWLLLADPGTETGARAESPPAAVDGAPPRSEPIAPVAEEAPLAERVARRDAKPVRAKTSTLRTQPREGVIAGVLRDAADLAPVGPASVSLVRDGETLRTRKVKEDGSYTFRHLRAGHYLVCAADLPPGYLPPFEQTTEVSYKASVERGYFATTVDVSGDEEVEQDLFVTRSLSITGIVLDGSDQPVEGVHVRAQRLSSGLQRVHSDDHTNADGTFEMNDVRPGFYRVEIHLGADHPLADTTRPPPQDLEIRIDFPSPLVFRMGGGDRTLSGRVIDQDGAPYANGTVRCFYWKPNEELLPGEWPYYMSDLAAITHTDESGRFSLSLQPSRVGLRVDFCEPGRPVWDPKRKLSENHPTVYADLRTSDQELLTLSVQRARPYIVEGKIVGPQRPRDYEVVVFSRPDDTRGEVVDVGRDGAFRWGCDTPHHEVALTVRKSMGKSVVWATSLVPSPDSRETLEIRL